MKTIYKNKIIEIYKDRVNLPNSVSFERVFVKTGNKVIVIPITNDGKFLFGNFFSPITKTMTMRFPRGSINEKENPLTAAKRELLEETGFEAEKFSLFPKLYYPNAAWHHEHWQIIFAENITQKTVAKDKFEDLGIALLTEKEIEQKIINGEIFDASTIVTFYIFKLALKGVTF